VNLTFIDFLVSGVLATIMFGIGLSISVEDLKEIVKSPRAFAVGLFSQMIILPVLAFFLTFFTNLSPAIKVGFIILAASPGGTTSGFITVLFRGNVALSVALTTINSILTLITIPLVVNLALGIYFGKHSPFELPFIESFLQIFFVTLLPASTGVFIRYKWDGIAEKIQKPIRTIMIVLFAGVYSFIFFAGEPSGGSGISFHEVMQILPYALAVNITALITGIAAGRLGRTGIKSSFTISIEVAVHNTTLALLVAGTLIQQNDMIKPALVYAMFSFWTAILFGLIVKKNQKLPVFGEFV